MSSTEKAANAQAIAPVFHLGKKGEEHRNLPTTSSHALCWYLINYTFQEGRLQNFFALTNGQVLLVKKMT